MKAYALLASMVVIGLSAGGTPATAQSIPEELRRFFHERHEDYKEGREIREVLFRLHKACEDGDRRACVHFGMIIGENKEHREEWRREHPEFFSWFRL